MKAFKGTIQNKRDAVKEAKRHRAMDMLISGTYGEGEGENFKGCSVGCTYKPFEGKVEVRNLHALSEPVHGIPESLTRLRDKIFERLPKDQRNDWHVNFIMSINVGANLSGVIDKWMLLIVTDVQKYAKGKTLAAIKIVITLYERKIAGDNPTREEWFKARQAAYAAAYAADAAAADAAYAAAYAADAAAYAAAYAADAAAAAADAYAAAYAAYAADAAYAARKKSLALSVSVLLKIIKETK